MNAKYRVQQGYLIADTTDLMVQVYEQAAPAGVVLISGAIGVSCTEPRYLMTLLARKLAEDGATVVQYDHPADGDSTGDVASLTAAELFDAGRRMLDFAERLSSGPLAMVGYGWVMPSRPRCWSTPPYTLECCSPRVSVPGARTGQSGASPEKMA